MENPEGVLNLLDEFAKVKSKEIPSDLEEYLLYVAASGDPVYQWSLIKSLYRQKLINVITDFYENSPMIDIPSCPNVDSFNYETMKNSLLERLDSFASAPFTIQRISELLTTPTKQYNRVDKFMRAIEKNIWVVSTREPGQRDQGPVQDASGNLVNGVAPRVRVTVKHPKRGKSIEERIKSGHSQLIDDDEEEEDEKDDAMEGKSNPELLNANNDSEDTPLQCTSVKDLLEKYENGTIFCGSEEKNVQPEEPAAMAEANATGVNAEDKGAETLETPENPTEQENDEEEVNIDKLVTPEDGPPSESGDGSEDEKLQDIENKEKLIDEDVAMPLVEVVENKESGENEANDAGDISEANDAGDISDANDAGDISDANDAGDISDANDVGDVSDVNDIPDVNGVNDASDMNDINDMSDVNDVSDMKDVNDVSDMKDVNDVNDESDMNDVNDENDDIPMPLVEDIKEDAPPALTENCPTELGNFCGEVTKPEVSEQIAEDLAPSEDSNPASVMEAMGLENELETNEPPQVESM